MRPSELTDEEQLSFLAELLDGAQVDGLTAEDRFSLGLEILSLFTPDEGWPVNIMAQVCGVSVKHMQAEIDRILSKIKLATLNPTR